MRDKKTRSSRRPLTWISLGSWCYSWQWLMLMLKTLVQAAEGSLPRPSSEDTGWHTALPSLPPDGPDWEFQRSMSLPTGVLWGARHKEACSLLVCGSRWCCWARIDNMSGSNLNCEHLERGPSLEHHFVLAPPLAGAWWMFSKYLLSGKMEW